MVQELNDAFGLINFNKSPSASHVSISGWENLRCSNQNVQMYKSQAACGVWVGF